MSTIHGPIVTLLAGRDRKPFKVHREILIAKSPYFSRLLPTPQSENQNLALDADPSTIALFVNFLYWQHYTLPHNCSEKSEQLSTHARLYILGLRFRIARLMEEALLKIYLLVKDETRCDDRRLELVKEVYTSISTPEDELKRMLAATVAARWEDYRRDFREVDSEVGMLMEEFPGFMREVLGRLCGGSAIGPPQHLVQVRSMKRKKEDCD